MRGIRLATLVILSTLSARASAADELAEGRAIVASHCARCHAIDREGASPLAAAPPFRTLGARYPLDDLDEALAEGILTGHPEMPQFSFDPDQIDAIIAYLKSIQPK